MTPTPPEDAGQIAPAGNSEAAAAAMRFLRTVRLRFPVVVAFLAIGAAVGAAYYTLAARKYQSRATLLVQKIGSATGSGSTVEAARTTVDEMPTYMQLLTADRVLKETLQMLPADMHTDLKGVSPERWLEEFKKRFTVSVVRKTNFISVAYTSGNPEVAHAVVQSLISAYVPMMNTLYDDATRRQLDKLEAAFTALDAEIRADEEMFMKLQTESGLLLNNSEDSVSIANQTVQQLNTDLQIAQKLTSEARTDYDAISRAIEAGHDLKPYAMKFNEQLGSQLMGQASGLSTNSSDSFTLGKMQSDLLDYQAQLKGLIQQGLGPRNSRVLQLQDQIAQTEQYLATRPEILRQAVSEQADANLAPQLLEMARNQYEIALNNERDLQARYDAARATADSLSAKVVLIQGLNVKLERNYRQYELISEQIQSLELNRSGGVVVKPTSLPRVESIPVAPRLRHALSILLLIGLGGGLSMVYLLDLIDDRFRSPDDLRAQIGAPILAMVRKLPRLPATHGLESLYPFAKPNATESEPFRSLRAALDFSPEDTRKITISSTEPSDGKTTMMASMAVAFAQAGKRTLVIDADMRRPGLTKLFEMHGQPGLSSILRSEGSVSAEAEALLLRPEGLDGYDVLPAGPKPSNPAELLSTERFSELIGWAEAHYDQVLVDAPPSLAVADVQIIGRVVDGAILTVRPDKNKRKMCLRAAEALTALGCPLLGIVVNQLTEDSAGDYGYGYGYGHDEEPVADDAPQTIPLVREAA